MRNTECVMRKSNRTVTRRTFIFAQPARGRKRKRSGSVPSM